MNSLNFSSVLNEIDFDRLVVNKTHGYHHLEIGICANGSCLSYDNFSDGIIRSRMDKKSRDTLLSHAIVVADMLGHTKFSFLDRYSLKLVNNASSFTGHFRDGETMRILLPGSIENAVDAFSESIVAIHINGAANKDLDKITHCGSYVKTVGMHNKCAIMQYTDYLKPMLRTTA